MPMRWIDMEPAEGKYDFSATDRWIEWAVRAAKLPVVGGPLIELHRAGRVRILAVTSRTRLKIAPDIPTALEAGLPGMVAETFNGLFAPAAVPRSLINQFAQATRTIAADPEFQRTLATSGFETILDSGPEAAHQLVSDELARWTPVMKATDFKLE
jgi:tripartite-type tricarboxylate transporter receptor subunit TctC